MNNSPRLMHVLKKKHKKASGFLLDLQRKDGSWEAEMIWNPMLTAQYVFAARITGKPISQKSQEGFKKHFFQWQREDGSWGMHDESHGYLFITCLVYVALRFLGMEAQDPKIARARQWIQKNGGAVSVPTWGKLWLAMVNLYEWDGIHPVLPELWLQPAWSPLHPRRLYCHTRLIYLSIGVLCARKFQMPESSLVCDLRSEIYLGKYSAIVFSQHRSHLHASDIFAWPTKLTLLAYGISGVISRLAPRFLRRLAIEACYREIYFELQSTGYACLSPVNGLLNALALWLKDPEDPHFHKTWAMMKHWLWTEGKDGYRYTGARSHTWDTSFVMQALAASTHKQSYKDSARRAFKFYENNQIVNELPNYQKHFRESLLGGYCFSDVYHRWPVSDCTAEALAALAAIRTISEECLPDQRLTLAAEFILKRQNQDGGFGSYEPRRGNWFLELFNPSEMYGNCMLEHSYIECTASCIHGLQSFLKLVPLVDSHRKKKIQQAVRHGMKYLRSAQLKDGSWPGFWGVNYTYGTMFGIMGLIYAGAGEKDPAVRKAVQWIYAHEHAEGGWGESWKSNVEERYIASKRPLVIQTSWALIGLALAGEKDIERVSPALRVLIDRQKPNGDYRKEGQSGVFFNTAMLHYMMYKNYFPVWAMNLWLKMSEKGTVF